MIRLRYHCPNHNHLAVIQVHVLPALSGLYGATDQLKNLSVINPVGIYMNQITAM